MLYKNKDASIEARIDDLLGRMSIVEKVGQVNQRLYGWQTVEKQGEQFIITDVLKDELLRFGGIGCLYGVFRADPWSKVTFETGIPFERSFEVTQLLQRYVRDNTRLGIPILFSEEVPHGHQALDTVLFPTNIGMGSTWNPALEQAIAKEIGTELYGKGVHLGLISTLDIMRDPRWGRSEECFSEDAYLSSSFTKAVVSGMQDGDLHEHVRSVLKHFVAQGTPVGGHNSGAAPIGERELREVFLPPMIAGIQAGASACMAAYNEIDGIPCHSNDYLLTKILREEFSFDGMVMADGVAIDRLVNDTISPEEGAAKALAAGVDLSLWDNAFSTLATAVEAGFTTVEQLDVAVRRILQLKFDLGLFDADYDNVVAPQSTPRKEVQALSLQAARESVVLLKNETLPLVTANKRFGLIGPNAYNVYNQLGDYTSPQRSENIITVLDGFEAAGINVSYAQGSSIKTTNAQLIDEVVQVAQSVDEVILVLGGSSARNFDMQFDANGAVAKSSRSVDMNCGENVDIANLDLPLAQLQLFDAVSAVNDNITLVLIQGRPHVITELAKKAKNVLCAWYPGPMGGRAITEIITGVVNPSGKLSVSIPYSSYQLPVYYNYKQDGAPIDYNDQQGRALYPFGYGLSFSTFIYGEAEYANNTITIAVKNDSLYDGFETVQLYIRANNDTTIRRIRELKAFQKVYIAAGEEKLVTFDCADIDWTYWNNLQQYVETRGMIDIFIGSDSLAQQKLVIERGE